MLNRYSRILVTQPYEHEWVSPSECFVRPVHRATGVQAYQEGACAWDEVTLYECWRVRMGWGGGGGIPSAGLNRRWNGFAARDGRGEDHPWYRVLVYGRGMYVCMYVHIRWHQHTRVRAYRPATPRQSSGVSQTTHPTACPQAGTPHSH